MRKVLLLLLPVMLAAALLMGANEKVEESELIRFHVIANSDTAADQQLKRQVRDAVMQEFGAGFANAASIEEVRRVLQSQLTAIEAAAQAEVYRRGYRYPVRAVLGRFPFPIKSYGNLTLPAGTYEALRIVIGQGRGENWWCVLFPPLCFVDISGDKGGERAVPTLGGEETGKKIKVRLKLLELLANGKSLQLGEKERHRPLP